MAGEQILIRKGNAVVELRPAKTAQSGAPGPLAPREALRRLQEEAQLTKDEAERYLRNVREERLAAEIRHPA